MSEKKPDIWMPLYVADYQADTAYLTTEHHGAYLLMLMAYWRNGPIPDNNGIIAAITRQSPDAWSITRAVLEPFFQVRDGFWFHKRVEQEYDKARKNRAVHHDRAVKAAKARWDKENAQAMLVALPEDMPMQCPSPSPSPTPSKAVNQSSPSDLSPAKADNVPAQQVADAYNEICGDLYPQVLKVTDKRRKAIRARWLADVKNPDERKRTDSLEYWRRYFVFCRTGVEFFKQAASGENKGSHAGWRPDFDFLMTEKTWLGVKEGKYQ